MKKYLLSFLTLILVLTSALAQRDNQIQNHLTYNGRNIGFYEYKPTSYTNGSDKHPVIIFLHGVGQKGNGTTELINVLQAGLPKVIYDNNIMSFKNPKDQYESFIVLSPQLPMESGTWENLYVDAMLEHAKTLRVDPNRIYLTGLSLGGGGTWRYAYTSLENAKKFAAIAPIASTREVVYKEEILCPTIAAAKTAVWAFHNTGDGGQTEPWNTESPCRVLSGCPDYNTVSDPRLVKTMYPDGGHDAWTKAYSVNNSVQTPNLFEWFLRFSRPALIANAGADQFITAATAKVQVDGSASTAPPAGSISTFQWSKLEGPAQHTIVSPGAAATEINNLVAGVYIFNLTITANDGSTATDDVKITVSSSTAALVANAGPDETIPQGQSTVIDGKRSTSGGTINSYKWTKISGPSQYNLLTPNAQSTWVQNTTAGTYTFRLTITDDLGGTATDDVNIVVTSTTPSTKPIANAGADHSVPPDRSTPLDGRASTDPDGVIASYLWEKYSGPSSYNLVSKNEALCWLNTLTAGHYIFILTVTDNQGNTAWDTVSVKVAGAAANQPPVAKAGPDINLQVQYSAHLVGDQSSDPDGTIATYRWSKTSGPASYYLVSPDAKNTWLNSMVVGVYTFKLTVTDNSGLSHSDEVTVTVTENTSLINRGDDLIAFEGQNIKLSVKTYPNPVINTLNYYIEGKTNGPAEIQITDMKGRVIKRSTIIKDQAKLSGTIAVDDLVTGVYTIQFTFKNVKERVTMSFVK